MSTGLIAAGLVVTAYLVASLPPVAQHVYGPDVRPTLAAIVFASSTLFYVGHEAARWLPRRRRATIRRLLRDDQRRRANPTTHWLLARVLLAVFCLALAVFAYRYLREPYREYSLSSGRLHAWSMGLALATFAVFVSVGFLSAPFQRWLARRSRRPRHRPLR